MIGGAASPAHPTETTWKVALTWSEALSEAAIDAGPPPLPSEIQVTPVDPTEPLAWEAAVVSASGPDWADALVPAIGERNNIETCKSTERQTLLDKALEQGLLIDGSVLDALTQALPGTDQSATISFDPLPASFTDSAGTEIDGAVPCHLRFSYPTMTPSEDCGAGDLQPQLGVPGC